MRRMPAEGKRFSREAFTWEETTMATPLTAKINAKVAGERPYSSCITNGEPTT